MSGDFLLVHLDLDLDLDLDEVYGEIHIYNHIWGQGGSDFIDKMIK
jgi:hypothetical protein